MMLQHALRNHPIRRQLIAGSTTSNIIVQVVGSNTNRQVSTLDINLNIQGSKKTKSRQAQKQKRDSGRASYRFVDRTRVRAAGGSGGNGSLSMFRIGRKHKRRPDGGHGGSGGSVIIVADPREQSLRWTHPHVAAESGKHGSSQKKNGRNGKNLVLRVPLGVVVRRVLDVNEMWDPDTRTVIKAGQEDDDLLFDQEEDQADIDDDDDDDTWSDDYDSDDSDDDDDDLEAAQADFGHVPLNLNTKTSATHTPEPQEDVDYEYLDNPDLHQFTPWGEREKIDIADLDKPGAFVVIAKGGRGGIGSSIFAGRHGSLLKTEVLSKIAKPKEGEEAALELELKLIADVGLVGFPNAGKSSLLAAMSRATPHIAPYPFTTINPLVGYIEYKDGFRVCAADVPGLIAGASEGRGKGIDFLRHLERTKALLYIVDAAGVDGRDPIEDLRVLANELLAYANGDMMNRRSIIIANKTDLLDERQIQEIIRDLGSVAEEVGIQYEGDILGISAGVTGQGLAPLSKAIRHIVTLSDTDRPDWDQK
jgi:GTP-binding protein